MLGAAEMRAATVTLAWDRNPEPNIAGYVISYGTSSRSYTASVDVGNVTTSTISLTSGFRYFFAVQAYNTAGLWSTMSNEVSADLSQTSAAPSITNLSVTSGSIGTVVTISGANFGSSQGTSTVRFNGTAATPTSWSASAIGVPVPNGATTGPIVVTVNNVTSNGATFTVATSSLPAQAPSLSQDLNGDGKPDLVWMSDSTRQAVVWYLGGSQGNIFQRWDWLSSAGVAGWTVVGLRDFNGDGKPDLVWQNDATQQVVVWYLGGPQGNSYLGSGWLAQDGVAGWYVVATGDFNGDGKPDLVWQNDARQVAVWYMGGAQGNTFLRWDWLSSTGVTGWRVVGTGDFNGDGKPDLVFQNDARQVAVWYMGGAQGNAFLSWDWLSSTGVTGWRVVGAGDFNGDGKPDLVYQNDAGQVAVWYMGGAQGNTFLSWDWLGLANSPAPPGWRAIAR